MISVTEAEEGEEEDEEGQYVPLLQPPIPVSVSRARRCVSVRVLALV